MKAQRRHELKTNVLYAWLSRASARAGTHKGVIFVALLVLVGAVSILYLWHRRSKARPREAWTLLSTSTGEEQYRRLVDEYGPTRPAYEGRLFWATELYERKLYTQARERYEQVLAHAGNDTYLGARTLLGLATVAEQQRLIDDAVQLYTRIIEEYPAPGCVWLAKERVRALKSPYRSIAPPEALMPRPVSRPRVPLTTGPADRPRVFDPVED